METRVTSPQPTDASQTEARTRLLFEHLMREHNARLFRLALGIVGEPAEAEDVLQDSYVRAFRGHAGFAGRSSIGAWLARIVRNTAIDHLRARRSRRGAFFLESELPAQHGTEDSALAAAPAQERGCNPELLLGDRELRSRLESAIRSLPPAFRSVFILREIQGLSLRETADELGVPVATVKSRDHRARLLLRAILGAHADFARLRLFEFLGERCDRIVASVLARVAGDSCAGTFAGADPSSRTWTGY
jgi:RNA polymerase sigma-70 factor (ECF subfamily)